MKRDHRGAMLPRPSEREWTSIRPARSDDRARMRASALRFLTRWGIPRMEDDPVDDVNDHIAALRHPYADPEDRRAGRELARRWRRVVRRALHEPMAHGILRGWIGYAPTEDPLTPPNRTGNLTRTRMEPQKNNPSRMKNAERIF